MTNPLGSAAALEMTRETTTQRMRRTAAMGGGGGGTAPDEVGLVVYGASCHSRDGW